MFEGALHLHEPWWRRIISHPESPGAFQAFITGTLILSAFDYIYLWAFEVNPEIYFEPNLSAFQNFVLAIVAFPLVQALLGWLSLAAIYTLRTSSSYFQLLAAWGFAALSFASYALVASVQRIRLASTFSMALLFVMLFILWRFSMKKMRIGPIHGPRRRPITSANRLRLLGYCVLGLVALSWYAFEFRQPDNLSEAAPFIGERMINRRGAWFVEQFTENGEPKPYPAQRVFFRRNGSCLAGDVSSGTYGDYKPQSKGLKIDCLPLGPTQLDYRFEADKLYLSAPGFSLTLRQDNWGPGYYNDIFAIFRP